MALWLTLDCVFIGPYEIGDGISTVVEIFTRMR